MLAIWIAFAAITAFIALAKRGRGKRRMGKYIKGQVQETVTLTTLAAKTLVSATFSQAVNERTLISSLVATYAMTAFTKSTGDGPILVGIAHSDYDDAEIEATIEAGDSWDEGNLINQEITARKVRRIGIFDNPADEAESVVLNDGKPIKTKLNWILLQGQSLKLWAYNMGSSPLATTAPIVSADGHANLWPR